MAPVYQLAYRDCLRYQETSKWIEEPNISIKTHDHRIELGSSTDTLEMACLAEWPTAILWTGRPCPQPVPAEYFIPYCTDSARKPGCYTYREWEDDILFGPYFTSWRIDYGGNSSVGRPETELSPKLHRVEA